MSKKQCDFNENEQKIYNFQTQNKIEKIHKIFYDLSKKWDDKCFEQDCIYGKDHQGIKALSVKLSNFNVREDIKYLSIYSTKEVILDKNLTLKGGHFIVVAPVIKIPYHINIDLSGENGISYGGTGINKAENGVWNHGALLPNIVNIFLTLVSVSSGVFLGITQNISLGVGVGILGPGISMTYPVCGTPQNTKGGTDGADGLSGTSGKNGGNLILIAQKYEGIDNLGINVSGGHGGNGQGGGDGGSCNTSYITAPIKRAGGDGGNAGKAGCAGNVGNVKIYQQKNNITKVLNQSIIKQDQGNDGIPGQGGQGGIGWQGKLYTSGMDGTKGQNGEVKLFNENTDNVEIFQNLNSIKQDYIQFVTTYVPEAQYNPLEYIDIIGKDTDFNLFL